GLAQALRPQGLFAQLAARGGRPPVRRGRLAALSLLALPGLHGRRQVRPLPHHDSHSALVLPRKTRRMNRSALPHSLWALMIGNLVIGTGVMVVPGTLNDLSHSLGVSVPQ